MKSKLFKTMSNISDDLKRDARVLQGLTDEQLDMLLDSLEKEGTTSFSMTRSELEKSRQALSERTNLPGPEVASSLNLLTFLIRSSVSGKGSFTDILDDMVEVELIDVSARDRLLERMVKTEPEAEKIVALERKRAYELGLVRRLKASGHVCDLRLSLKERFEPFEHRIEDYEPEFYALTPVATVGIVLADVSTDRSELVSFQVNFESLEYLILELQACQKEMRLLRKIQDSMKVGD